MISFDNNNNIFTISTRSSSYVFGIWNDRLYHIYYGKRIGAIKRSIPEILSMKENGLSAVDKGLPIGRSSDIMPMEYPTFGSPDLRTPAFGVIFENGSRVVQLKFKSYRIIRGKEQPKGLPSLNAKTDDNVQTLIINLKDIISGLEVELHYTAFEAYDAIVRRAVIRNTTDGVVNLTNALSLSYDIIEGKKYDFMHLYGCWGREGTIERRPLFSGMQSIDSKRGASSPMHNPFFALLENGADERKGEVFGFSLIYSGNFFGGVEVDSYNTVRVLMGINPFNFNYKLECNEEFETPESVSVFSEKGLGEMSRSYHRLYQNHLMTSKFAQLERYILINNWEATYFDFTEEKILEIADRAKDLGLDMLVLDDGWFGQRNNDKCSLGDWVVNKAKLPDGIDGLSKKIHEKGLKFGLWFEPEMISPDSDLYRAHPDWAINAKGSEPSLGRFQMTLDLSNVEVCSYIIDTLSEILSSSDIDYVKWDMNRHFSEIGSAYLPQDRQSELPHRYMLGLYKVMDTLTKRFPNILFEGCSSGGGRFDPGILYYMPQIWASDVSDAVERLKIQYGLSMVYPFSSMGAHVSDVPNHQCNRVTPFEMRGNVAIMGQLGYELDLTRLSDTEREQIKEQVALYRNIEEIVHKGDSYRLKSPFEGDLAAFQFVSSDKSRSVLVVASARSTPNAPFERVCLEGLDTDSEYLINETGEVMTGSELENIGIPFVNNEEHKSFVYTLSRKPE